MNQVKKYTIAQHNKQNKSRALQSHHPESQKALQRAIANYSAKNDMTILLPESQHKKTFKPQAAQRAPFRGNPTGFDAQLGLSESIRDAAKIMQRAGVPKKIANQAALAHDSYLKGTTPVSQVKETIQKFWTDPERRSSVAKKTNRTASRSNAALPTPKPEFEKDSKAGHRATANSIGAPTARSPGAPKQAITAPPLPSSSPTAARTGPGARPGISANSQAGRPSSPRSAPTSFNS